MHAKGRACQGQCRKSVRMPAPHTSTAGSQEELPKKKQRLARPAQEEESNASSDETEEPEDVDLEDTSKGSERKDERVPNTATSEVGEEFSKEDEDDESGDDEAWVSTFCFAFFFFGRSLSASFQGAYLPL